VERTELDALNFIERLIAPKASRRALVVCGGSQSTSAPLHAVRGEAEHFSTRLNDAATHVLWVRVRDQAGGPGMRRSMSFLDVGRPGRGWNPIPISWPWARRIAG
jgi:hypothetical protein